MYWLRWAPKYNMLSLLAAFVVGAQRPPENHVFSASETDLHQQVGSSWVLMDSWLYPALERLADFGLITGQEVSIPSLDSAERVCQRQVVEAEQVLHGQSDAKLGRKQCV